MIEGGSRPALVRLRWFKPIASKSAELIWKLAESFAKSVWARECGSGKDWNAEGEGKSK